MSLIKLRELKAKKRIKIAQINRYSPTMEF
jgi:hypothetical protein